jgi:hypothetical protein
MGAACSSSTIAKCVRQVQPSLISSSGLTLCPVAAAVDPTVLAEPPAPDAVAAVGPAGAAVATAAQAAPVLPRY